MEWIVVTVLVALAGLFLTVGTPILKLNSNIVKLNCTMEALKEKTELNAQELKEQKLHDHDAHQRIWDHNDEQDKKLADHERRIGYLEKK